MAWIVADVICWHSECSYDVWHDCVIFYFLNVLEEREAYCDAMACVLWPGGVAVIGIFAKDGFEYCSELLV